MAKHFPWLAGPRALCQNFGIAIAHNLIAVPLAVAGLATRLWRHSLCRLRRSWSWKRDAPQFLGGRRASGGGHGSRSANQDRQDCRLA
ncbi:MAG: hypothetical protein R3D29_10405 [Nitratireductor sp.]